MAAREEKQQRKIRLTEVAETNKIESRCFETLKALKLQVGNRELLAVRRNSNGKRQSSACQIPR